MIFLNRYCYKIIPIWYPKLNRPNKVQRTKFAKVSPKTFPGGEGGPRERVLDERNRRTQYVRTELYFERKNTIFSKNLRNPID